MNVKAMSGADLARCFGVDRSMITRWKKAGMPEHNGLFCLPECIKWRLEREAEAMESKAATPEGEKWLTEFRKERARMAKLERLKLRGQLLSRQEVVDQWCNRAAEMKQGLLGFSVRLPPRLEGRTLSEIRDVIEEEARRLLESYARPGTYCETRKGGRKK